LSEQTRQAVDDYLKADNKRPGEFLFTGRRGPQTSLTTRQYARLVSDWIGSVRVIRVDFDMSAACPIRDNLG
jgi:hypothetical protein